MAVLQSKCLTLSGTTDLPLYPTDLHKLPNELHAWVPRSVCSSQKKKSKDYIYIYIFILYMLCQSKNGDYNSQKCFKVY
jgi:hypothetical protein